MHAFAFKENKKLAARVSTAIFERPRAKRGQNGRNPVKPVASCLWSMDGTIPRTDDSPWTQTASATVAAVMVLAAMLHWGWNHGGDEWVGPSPAIPH